MSEHDREMELKDGRLVLVDYVVESLGSDPSGMSGPPENYDPGSGPELYITKIQLAEGSDDEIVVTDEERWRLEAILCENSDWWMPSDDYEDDWWDHD